VPSAYPRHRRVEVLNVRLAACTIRHDDPPVACKREEMGDFAVDTELVTVGEHRMTHELRPAV
jgi:hypothetical protein